MEDLISRREAINAIVNSTSRVQDEDMPLTDQYDGATFRQIEILGILDSLPSVDPWRAFKIIANELERKEERLYSDYCDTRARMKAIRKIAESGLSPKQKIDGIKSLLSLWSEDGGRGKMSRLYAVYKDEWIPTSERVPRNEGVYLVTVHYHIEGMPPETKVARFYNGSWEFDDCRAVSLFSKVVAWMVMPDPYEGLNERSER